MKKVILSLIAISLLTPAHVNASDFELNRNWTFKSKDGISLPISTSSFLVQQIDNSHCCDGVYSISLETETLSKLRDETQPLALFIPGIGGLREITIGRTVISPEDSDFTTKGLIVPFDRSELEVPNLQINITIAANPSYFIGFSKVGSYPRIGSLNDLLSTQQNQLYQQHTIPLINSIVLLLFGITFLLIDLIIRNRNPLYRRFSIALILWSQFYIFLSGAVREINFEFGSNLHFASRSLASYGMFLLLTRVSSLSEMTTKKVNLTFAIIVLLQLITIKLEQPILQSIIYLIAAIVSAIPIAKLNKNMRGDIVGILLVALGIISVVGQIFDAVKLHQGILGIEISFPYLNRYTFLPLLLVSFGDCIIQFAGSFHQLRAHLFKAKSYARTILHSAKQGLSHENVDYFLKVTGKICGYTRVSLAQRLQDGSYQIVKIYGAQHAAEGNLVNQSKLPEVGHAIQSGEITFGKVNEINLGWKTPEFVAVPVPEIKDAPYVMLLSDPKKTNLNTKETTPYLSQISSALWTNLERSREQSLRIQTEKKFTSLVQQLDPNLYEFITSNMNKIHDPSKSLSGLRGIVFFDQKGYSTITENFNEDTMAQFAQIVANWVTQSAARFGARISNFAGDAFLLETISIGDETDDSIAFRTLELAWNLNQTLGELNQVLMSQQFSPISFRFGAHIGRVSSANLDFIQKGLSNSIGDTVNVASRLQSLAKPGTIYISGELAKITKTKFLLSQVPRQYVKGRSKTIEIYSVIGRIEESPHQEAVAS